jgi:hypothetical protein
MMTDDARQTVRQLDYQRQNARARLSGDAEQAKHDLHPRTLARRWTDQKKEQFADLADSGKQSFKKKAPLIGLAGAAILLFAARKPISNLFNHLRDKAKDRKS